MRIRAVSDLMQVRVGETRLALPVSQISDVFDVGPLVPAPLAPPFVAGLVNYRGRTVCVLSLALLLGLPDGPAPTFGSMAVGVQWQGQGLALQVDAAEEVVPRSALSEFAPGGLTHPAVVRHAFCGANRVAEINISTLLETVWRSEQGDRT